MSLLSNPRNDLYKQEKSFKARKPKACSHSSVPLAKTGLSRVDHLFFTWRFHHRRIVDAEAVHNMLEMPQRKPRVWVLENFATHTMYLLKSGITRHKQTNQDSEKTVTKTVLSNV